MAVGLEATRLMNITSGQFVIQASVAAAVVTIAVRMNDILWFASVNSFLHLNWISLEYASVVRRPSSWVDCCVAVG